VEVREVLLDHAVLMAVKGAVEHKAKIVLGQVVVVVDRQVARTVVVTAVTGLFMAVEAVAEEALDREPLASVEVLAETVETVLFE